MSGQLMMWISLGLALAIIGLDIWLVVSKHRTITSRIREYHRSHPWLAFIMGMLAGHFFGGW